MELINCSSCGSKEFEKKLISGISLHRGSVIQAGGERTVWVCIQCGYVIQSEVDLILTVVDIHIVGNSMSGMRQGINQSNIDKEIYQESFDSVRLKGHYQLNPNCWIFTESTWKDYTAKQPFSLCDSPHKFNEIWHV